MGDASLAWDGRRCRGVEAGGWSLKGRRAVGRSRTGWRTLGDGRAMHEQQGAASLHEGWRDAGRGRGAAQGAGRRMASGF
ncbi:hypothetical protein E2562_020164 [Oryza meyeriana var. granulata]|uniref:Uncharacterized protein n=1 Tax=Oryza meyeriana var. granulata TaxID=110450 RepID=A0A6G1BM18_9ORYZ|nr:hypothetical protein E2562_020164 [Oryza meyeriana var. granulata]